MSGARVASTFSIAGRWSRPGRMMSSWRRMAGTHSSSTCRPRAMRPALVDAPLVSVVIAAYDEEAHIERCLASLQLQTYVPLEIIVVDDGSRDRTAALAGRTAGVQVISTQHRGAGVARNTGARHALGDILVFLDADMSFPEMFVERLVAPLLLDPDEVGSFTREIMVANTSRRWARAHQLG